MGQGPPAGATSVSTAELQRILLPAHLPDVEAWSLASLYQPMGEDVLVGGDFYDWFSLPTGRFLFFVGDVSGKGPLAGALAMSIRKALKGITWVTGDPMASLPLLEGALSTEFGEAFATLCMVEMSPGSGALRLLLAGHPAPWVRRDGVFAEVDAPPNSLLGPGLTREWTSVEVHLAPGDALVMFTDGLTEARLPDGTMFGDRRWRSFLQGLPPGLSGYEVVLRTDTHLHELAGTLADDVLIAVLTHQPRASTAPH